LSKAGAVSTFGGAKNVATPNFAGEYPAVITSLFGKWHLQPEIIKIVKDS
jgi:hypothetical protein